MSKWHEKEKYTVIFYLKYYEKGNRYAQKNDNGGGDFAKCSIKIVKVVKCCAIL